MKESYHKPVGLTAKQHDEDREKAKRLEDRIAHAFTVLKKATPWRVYQHFRGKVLIGSIRRAMTNLTGERILIKFNTMVNEMHGKPNHLWVIDLTQYKKHYGTK